jgi:hypothetical protein
MPINFSSAQTSLCFSSNIWFLNCAHPRLLMSCSAASVSKQRADKNIWTCSVIRSRTIKPSECVTHADLTISSYKSIILPSVLYGTETWFLTL